jgi:hypothetical protein
MGTTTSSYKTIISKLHVTGLVIDAHDFVSITLLENGSLRICSAVPLKCSVNDNKLIIESSLNFPRAWCMCDDPHKEEGYHKVWIIYCNHAFATFESVGSFHNHQLDPYLMHQIY